MTEESHSGLGSGALREALIGEVRAMAWHLRNIPGSEIIEWLESCAPLSLSSPIELPAICGVIGYPEQGKQVCELLAGHEGYHRQKGVRWLGAWKPWDTTPESPTPQASSEIRERVDRVLRDFHGGVLGGRERYELAKLLLDALAPSRQGAG